MGSTSGWADSINFLVSNTYFGKDEIKPYVDLTVHNFDETTTTIQVSISGHEPRPFGLNYNRSAGPFIRAVNSKLIDKHTK